jgi:hypothetical protein
MNLATATTPLPVGPCPTCQENLGVTAQPGDCPNALVGRVAQSRIALLPGGYQL